MILQEKNVDSLLRNFMQWGFIIILVIILIIIVSKWGLKKAFPKLTNLFYFIIPTYIINFILVSVLKTDEINEYTIFEFPSVALYICPPLVWDALFGMGMAQERFELLFVATFFILFIPIWIAWRTSSGVTVKNSQDNNLRILFLKRLACAWMIVVIMGLGLTNFSLFILDFLVINEILGLSLVFWIAMGSLVIIILVYFMQKRKKDKNIQPECEWIDGKWVCSDD